MENKIRQINELASKISKSRINFKKSPKERLSSISYLETRLESLELQIVQFNEAHDKLFTEFGYEVLKTSENFDTDLLDTTEEIYIDCKTMLKDCIRELNISPEMYGSCDNTSSSTSKDSDKARIRLPKIIIPSFSGRYSEWISFRDLFLSLIHNNDALDKVQKMHYLKSYLTGEAEKLVRHVSVSNSNYQLCWEQLEKRYNNRRYIVNCILKRLMSQRVILTDSSFAVKELLDNTNECLNLLKNLNVPIENWDILIIHILCSKLDTESRRLWEAKVCDYTDELPSFKQFQAFLEQRFRSLEFCDTKVNNNNNNYKATNAAPKALHAMNMCCPYCSEEHKLYNCKKFCGIEVDTRRKFVQTKGLCFNCMGPNHSVFSCKMSFRCKVCKRKHHSLLHAENAAPAEVVPSREKPTTSAQCESQVSCFSNMFKQVLLATALVKAETRTGAYLTLRSLLDQGSQASVITEAAVQYLGLRKLRCNELKISGLGSDQTGSVRSKFVVKLRIQSLHNSDLVVETEAYVLKTITSFLPERKITLQNLHQFDKTELADPDYHVPNKIDLLLGADIYAQIIESGVIKGPPGYPVAQKTKLGWILSGCIMVSKPDILRSHTAVVINDNNELLQRFWEIESENTLGLKKILTDEEKRCEEIFSSTTRQDDSGRYIVKLPFRSEDPGCKYGNSKDIATRRFQLLEKKLQRNPKLKIEYAKVINEYLELGHMEYVPENEIENANAVYLPHHAVVKEDRTTTKVRVVFDASCRGTNGKSLNSDLMVGPTLQPELRHLILKWRTYPICIIADIVKMYRQVKVFPEDADFQRILWRDPDKPYGKLQHFRLLTVTFGTASAPYLAVKALQQAALDHSVDDPSMSEIILKDFYMDDLMTGCQDLKEGEEIYEKITTILQNGGFILQKWGSNNDCLLKKMNYGEEKNKKELIEIKGDDTRKILGLTWNPKCDEFVYSVKLPTVEYPITKRSVISDIARLYDPLGWIAPIIITAKIFIQKLWLSGIDWDQELPQQFLNEWIGYRNNLNVLTNFRMPRWIQTRKEETILELHGFCDASNSAYGAVIYCRVVDKEGNIYVNLVTSKTRVAPIKTISVPRLELCGAVLLTKLLTEVAYVLNIDKKSIRAWTDSTVVLAWLSDHPSRWKTFVANRVSDILTQLDRSQWSYVKSAENPADCASRGVQPTDFCVTDLWINGPSWLKNKEIIYNKKISCYDIKEEERTIKNYHVTKREDFNLWSKYSSLNKLLRVISYCRRFLRSRSHEKVNNEIKSVTSIELNEALNICIRYCQRLHFLEELDYLKKNNKLKPKGKLNSLNPFIDQDGILRVGGRLRRSDFSEDMKHPIILPKASSLTKLLLAYAHEKTIHGGPQLMVNYLRTKYWILDVKNLAKYYVRKCIVCVRYAAQTNHPLMGQLPSSRVVASRPFIQSGVDYAGPISIKISSGRGYRCHKGYICLFVCMATRAVHLEVVSDMTSQAFINAFKRFVARRGHCTDIFSDNGTNFVGASKELKQLLLKEKSSIMSELVDCVNINQTNWHFIPPRAPNFGGLWEAGIKSTKHHLRRIIGEVKLTFEELSTVLCQIEACLNSRPLSKISSDPDDPYPLTPGHFLVGGPLLLIPDANYEHTNISNLRRWQLTQRLVQHFWRRWSQEYLTQFYQRHKWVSQRPEPNVGDVVLVKESDLPPSKWLFGIIEKKHPGLDNITRVVTLRCKGTLIKRAVSKLCILPLAEDDSIL